MSLFMRRFGEELVCMLPARQLWMMQLAWPAQPLAGEAPWRKEIREGLAPKAEVGEDGIARIPVSGVLGFRPDLGEQLYMGMEDTEAVSKAVTDAAADPAVKGILLSVDSPGGYYNGGLDAADAIHEAGKVKPVVAHIGGMGASLAYMLASQARTVVAGRSAMVGSVGVRMTLLDNSRAVANAGLKPEVFTNREGVHKAAGEWGTSLTQAQRDEIQGQVQGAHDKFLAVIARARGNVKPEALQGQVLYGEAAKQAGLVDATGDEAYARSLLKAHINAQNQ